MDQRYDWLKDYFEGKTRGRRFEEYLALELEAVEEGSSTLKLTVEEKHLNHHGIIHGGVLASICDVAMGTAVATFNQKTVTTDLSVQYIGNVPAGSEILARGWVIHRGNHLIRTMAEVRDKNGKLLTSSSASFFIIGGNLNGSPADHQEP